MGENCSTGIRDRNLALFRNQRSDFRTAHQFIHCRQLAVEIGLGFHDR
jgi:hypothetical protein